MPQNNHILILVIADIMGLMDVDVVVPLTHTSLFLILNLLDHNFFHRPPYTINIKGMVI